MLPIIDCMPFVIRNDDLPNNRIMNNDCTKYKLQCNEH